MTSCGRKSHSLSRHVPPGSREWDILYRKYFEEEARKQRTLTPAANCELAAPNKTNFHAKNLDIRPIDA